MIDDSIKPLAREALAALVAHANPLTLQLSEAPEAIIAAAVPAAAEHVGVIVALFRERGGIQSGGPHGRLA